MISLIHPSRARPAKAYHAYKRWMSRCANPENVEHILSLDSDDTSHYEHLFTLSKVIQNPNHNAVQAVNEAAKVSKGEILIMMSDDFDCPQGWDKTISEAMYNYHGIVLKTFDGIQKWIVTLAIMDREYYDMNGYFYYPGYSHLFVDTDLTHKAELEKRLIVRNDIIFNHWHYTVTREKQDETTKRADATWEAGEKLYLQRCKDKFGLPPETDIMNISEGTHKEWIRAKLNGEDARMRLPKRNKLFT